jgi:hypothetical protein
MSVMTAETYSVFGLMGSWVPDTNVNSKLFVTLGFVYQLAWHGCSIHPKDVQNRTMPRGWNMLKKRMEVSYAPKSGQ